MWLRITVTRNKLSRSCCNTAPVTLRFGNDRYCGFRLLLVINRLFTTSVTVLRSCATLHVSCAATTAGNAYCVIPQYVERGQSDSDRSGRRSVTVGPSTVGRRVGNIRNGRHVMRVQPTLCRRHCSGMNEMLTLLYCTRVCVSFTNNRIIVIVSSE